MARPPLSLGHHGTIKVTKDGDQWVGHDGAERLPVPPKPTPL
jgi:hypothetical protein